METGERWRLGHRPALDGLRGVAVLLVVQWHAGHALPWLHSAGAVGVTVFFTLSGFLITGLLLEEHGRTGRVDLVGFLRRRALRLLPALVVMLALVGVLAMQLPGLAAPGAIWHSLLYVGNWQAASGHPMGSLVHTWSLSVEEQFYLAFPPIAWLALRWRGRRALLLVSTLAAAASLADRIWLTSIGATTARIYYGTDTAAFGLLVGCALACWLAGRTFAPVARPQVGLVLVGGTVAAAAWGSQYAIVASALVTAAAIVAFGAAESPLSARPLRWLGRRSYGLYLWHLPILTLTLTVLVRLGHAAWLLVALSIALSITCASYRWVEKPFLRLKDRPTRIPSPGSTPAPSATAATLAA